MTGLNLDKDPPDQIMSIALFITDASLNLLDETGYEAVIRLSQSELSQMGEWCTNQHGASGLTAACLASTTTAEEAAAACLSYIKRYVPEPKKALLAGNTVHADKAFLIREPWRPIVKYLHHRIFDVSAIKEAMRRWSPLDVVKGSPRKMGLHTARSDILESIAEARYYKDIIFQKGDGKASNNEIG